MTNNKIFKAVLFLFLVTNVAFAWGPVGHKTIANIAEDNLHPKAKQKILAILGTTDMASVASWPDTIRSERSETSPWHYVDLDVRINQTVDDIAKHCENDNCVVGQINKEIKELKAAEKEGGSNNDVKVEENLKFLIHFIGDLHQPMHCSNDDDKGGNQKIVRLFNKDGGGEGTKMNLHAVWDRLIEPTTIEDPVEFSSELKKEITRDEKKKWSSGTVESWALESYGIAKDKIYPEFTTPGPTPKDTEVTLSKDYYKNMRPIENEQMKKAGIRLAEVLNEIFL
ncbi:MAG: S1/P1 nuclease [Pseudomonadota bacterium]